MLGWLKKQRAMALPVCGVCGRESNRVYKVLVATRGAVFGPPCRACFIALVSR